MSAFPFRSLLIVLAIALLARIILLSSNAVSFHADEAVVGLMARHILQGERPVFFYGQPYMGSLDAWFIALGFRLLGESVLSIRVVESILYLLVVATGFVVAWRFSERLIIAVTAGLLLALPTPNVALYTTATLGGYNETLLMGNLLLLLGYDVTHEHQQSRLRWLLLGLIAGIGWWTNGLIVIYALPLSILIIYKHVVAEKRPVLLSLHLILPSVLLACLAFFLGSAPWWIFDFSHNHAALAIYFSNQQTGEFAGIGIPYVPPLQRAVGLLVIGLPTLVGMRFPWSSDYFLPLIGIPVFLIYIVAAYRLLRRNNPLKPDARGVTLGMLGLFIVVFVVSTYGADPTGRYFLPLTLPLGILLGTLVYELGKTEGTARTLPLQHLYPYALIFLVVGYQIMGQIAAANTPPGLTTQFDPVSHIPNDHDAELIAFLENHNLNAGYTNYWVAFRLAFLSGERLQYSSALPYKADLSYNSADNRYQPYQRAAEQAERVAYITTNLPELDIRLETRFAQQGITYQEIQIGLFHVYYDFQPGKPQRGF